MNKREIISIIQAPTHSSVQVPSAKCMIGRALLVAREHPKLNIVDIIEALKESLLDHGLLYNPETEEYSKDNIDRANRIFSGKKS